MEPTRTPLDRVVNFVSGISSDSSGTLGGMWAGRSGPMQRVDEIVYCVVFADVGLAALVKSAELFRVITGGSCRSGNSFSENFCAGSDGEVCAGTAAKDLLGVQILFSGRREE